MARLPKKTAKLIFEGEDEEIWVRVNLSVKLKTLMEFYSLSQDDENANLADVFQRFGKQIVLDWNVTDDDNNPIPVGPEGMLELDTSFAYQLISEWVKAVSQPADPLESTSNNGVEDMLTNLSVS